MKDQSLRYLLVEDDPLDTEIISAMLHRGANRNLDLTTVTRFRHARTLLKETSFDAIILDLNLPDAYGTGSIAVLLEEFPTLPIVILTGTDDDATAIACLQMGAQDYISKNQVNAELLARVMHYAVERKLIDLALKKALEEADRRNAELSLLARTDSLTRLPNRAYFLEVAEQTIASAERMSKSIGLLYFDLNGFKAINDNYGHGVGDQVLIEIGRRLKEQLRHGDTVARLGGDEFVVLSTMLEDSVQSYSVARKIHEIISAPMLIEGHNLSMSASIGISTYPEVASVEKLIEGADLAMYEAKSSGQHFAVFYTKNLAAKHEQQRMIEVKLNKAIDQGDMTMVFQPIYSIDQPGAYGAEALARWHDDSMGIISTDRFIPVAEAVSFGDHLSDYALVCLARLYQQCENDNIHLNRLVLNVFGNQFMAPDYGQRLLDQIHRLGLPPTRVCLEIPENKLIEHKDACLPQFKYLKEHGVKITLDNFGSGDLALRHLEEIPLDYIKLDRSLIGNVDKARGKGKLVRALINLAHTLGIRVIAGCIEQDSEYQALLEMQCDEFQGYLFSRPMNQATLISQWQTLHPSSTLAVS
ncbi:MAG: diguanylate cyclase (GGDEF)-like protein [Candidatus Azotimanducaceae bacterium]|jgi:diguanylate cyclase (GGDEF)-like protein